MNSTRWDKEGVISQLDGTTSMVQRIEDSSYDASTEGPQGEPHKVISSSRARKCEKMASSLQMSPKTDPATFQKAQIAVSEVLG